MGLWALLTCCDSRSNKKSLATDAETRKARIVAVYQNSRNGSHYSVDHTSNNLPPPRYSDIVHDQTLIPISDSKNPDLPEQRSHDDSSHEQRSRSPAPTFSDESSVVSIPSTNLSGLTSTYTGNTARARMRSGGVDTDSNRSSWRDSGIYSDFSNSAPPSYYSESEAGAEFEASDLHPVMEHGWLEQLAEQAEARLRAENNGG